MKLVIDIQMIDKNSAGALTYIKNMVHEIYRLKDDELNIYFIGSQNNIDVLMLHIDWIYTLFPVKVDTKNPLSRFLYSFILRSNIDSMFTTDDVVWFPFNTGINSKYRNVRTLLTVHDFLVIDYPKCVPFFSRIFRRYSLLKSIQNADTIVTVSEFTKQQLYLHCSHLIYNKRVEMLYEGVSIPTKANITKNKINIKSPYILFVGVGRANKNLEFLLRSFEILVRRYDYKGLLVIAGNVNEKIKFQLTNIAKELLIDKLVYFIGYIEEGDLPYLYKQCDAFIFPSYYEGFGLPVLEANYFGAKVCCSDAASLKEVGRNFSNFFNPFNVDSCARTMRNTIKSKVFIPCDKEKFSWNKAAKKFIKLTINSNT
jgi:glycosyltransferase involved in cell wall biosynthesis